MPGTNETAVLIQAIVLNVNHTVGVCKHTTVVPRPTPESPVSTACTNCGAFLPGGSAPPRVIVQYTGL